MSGSSGRRGGQARLRKGELALEGCPEVMATLMRRTDPRGPHSVGIVDSSCVAAGFLSRKTPRRSRPPMHLRIRAFPG